MAGFNFQPIVQQYTPSPVAEFDAYGQQLNNRYEQNLASMDSLDILASQMEVLEGSRGIKDKAIGDIRNLMSEFQKRGDYENAAPKLRLAAKRLATDRNLKTAIENYQNAKKWDEELRVAKNNGINMLQFNDYRNERFDDRGDLISNANTSDNQKRLDWEGRQATYFDQLQPETVTIEESGYRRGANGLWEKYGNASSKGGISADRVVEQASRNLGSYLQTSEGQQQLKYLTSPRYGNMSVQDAQKQILNGLITSGMEKVFNNSVTKTASDYMANPFKQEQAMDLQLANAQANLEGQRLSNIAKRQAMVAATNGGVNQQGINIGDFLQSYKSESFGLDGTSKVKVADAFKLMSEGSGNKSRQAENVFVRNLNEIIAQGGKAGNQAKHMLNMFDNLKRAMPNSYKQMLKGIEELRGDNGIFQGKADKNYIRSTLASFSPAYTRLLETNRTEADKLANNIANTLKVARSQTDFGSLGSGERTTSFASKSAKATDFERAFQDLGASYQVEYVSPNLLNLPSEMRSAWNAFAQSPLISPDNFKYVSGANKDNMTGPLEVVGISAGKHPGVNNNVLEVRNKKGETFVVEPKNQKLTTAMLNFLGNEPLMYNHAASTNPEALKSLVTQLGAISKDSKNPVQKNNATGQLINIMKNLASSPEFKEDNVLLQQMATPANGMLFNIDALLKGIDKMGSTDGTKGIKESWFGGND